MLYYKGENVCPFSQQDQRAAFWELEYTWINDVFDEDVEDLYLGEFFGVFPDLCDEITKRTPTSLKAFMCARYYQAAQEYKGFPNFLQSYVLAANL